MPDKLALLTLVRFDVGWVGVRGFASFVCTGTSVHWHGNGNAGTTLTARYGME